MYKEKKYSTGSRLKTPCPEIKNQIKKEIKIENYRKKGVTSNKIDSLLSCTSNFLGCFAQDELATLTIQSLPVYLIINFDHKLSKGTHWVAIRISKKRLEIYDPLGFNVLRWPNVPHLLLDFLHKFSLHRRIIISKEIQPRRSTLCGFYCIFFVLYRQNNLFRNCVNVFSNKLRKNDKILLNLFN